MVLLRSFKKFFNLSQRIEPDMQAGVDERIQLELGHTLGEVEVIAEDNRPASLDEIRNHFAESQVVIRRINSVHCHQFLIRRDCSKRLNANSEILTLGNEDGNTLRKLGTPVTVVLSRRNLQRIQRLDEHGGREGRDVFI